MSHFIFQKNNAIQGLFSYSFVQLRKLSLKKRQRELDDVESYVNRLSMP